MLLHFTTLTNRLFRRLTPKPAPLTRNANQCRPALEALEARDVPALFTWTGAEGTDASNPDNWLEGVAPQPGATVLFTAGSSADCVGLSGSFSSVEVNAGYTGTVTFGPIAIEALSIHGGTVVVTSNTLSTYSAAIYGGTLDVQSDISLFGLGVFGGVVTVQGEATLGSLGVYQGSVTLASGGTVGYLPMSSGTLTLGAPVTANAFSLSGGQVAQAAGANLTVTGFPDLFGDEFTWTGGTLNSTANLANVTITGSDTTALFAPAGGGTIWLGSNLSLENGASGTMRDGAIDLNKDGIEFSTSTGSSFFIDPILQAVLGVTQFLDGKIGAGTTWMVSSDVGSRIKGVLLNEGTLTLFSEAYLEVTGGPLSPVAYAQQTQIGGDAPPPATFLYGGSQLVTPADKEVWMSGGILATVYSDGTGDATITTKTLEVAGGDIYVNYEPGVVTSRYHFSNLVVDGNVWWHGGTFHPYVYTDGTTTDVWGATGTFDIDFGTVVPTFVDSDNGTHSIPPPGGSWQILKANDGFVDFDTPNLVGNWILRPQQSIPPQYWRLIATN